MGSGLPQLSAAFEFRPARAGAVRTVLTVLTALTVLTVLARPASAHEVPARVTVLTFVKPEGSLLRVLVRVPLEAMRDVEFPVRGKGYLDLPRVGPQLVDAALLWIGGSLEWRENGRLLSAPRLVATRVSLPSDRAFASWETALAHVTGPGLPPETQLVWQQGMLDALFEYPIESEGSSFAVRPQFGRLGIKTTTVIRFLPQARAERAFQFLGDPGLVRLDPGWQHAAWGFVKLGFRHILGGLDHLLFVFCLLIPIRKLRPLVAIVTSFTLAHSITLAASTLGLAPTALWFPPLIETLIALSILYMAFENIIGRGLERRWVLAFGFGLVHGFGFSFFLRDSLQFAGGHLATGLLAFNLGVEAGQLLVIALALPLLAWAFRRAVPARIGIVLLSALVAHEAWHWMTARLATLRQYRFSWPALDPALLAGALRAALLLLVVGIAGWGMLTLARRLREPAAVEPSLGTGPR